MAESAQEMGGGAIHKGDRCVAELTTLLHRIERAIVEWQSKSATAEQQRYAASPRWGL
ncbi:MAG: hypothetical protein NW224_10900 [Leptolyngbyaceae cyanobacterium bins.302]|nr:hypothetical protein [Leptolyngbyaceae cyanobacterium bins.302]